MNKLLLTIMLAALLGGCASMQNFSEPTRPEVSKNTMQNDFDALPAPATGRPIVVAVYSFVDKTGQRKPIANVASLSTATTQGAEAFLIKALQDVGNGRWFRVVERVGIDNLTKERLIIRQMREAYEGANAQPLPPMTFAGIILEGGIVGYDSSTKSGGAAARWLGIGEQTQYSEDTVTISLRAVSVANGEVIAAVTVQKTVVSSADSVTALKFFSDGTKAFEAEAGLTLNEPVTLATKAAVEFAVVELIKEGKRKGVWDYARPVSSMTQPPVAPPADKALAQPIDKMAEPVKPVEDKKVEATSTPIKEDENIKEGQAVVKAASAWVRKGRSLVDPPVRSVREGLQVTVLQNQDGWSEVEFDDSFGHHKGWIKSNLLKQQEATKPEGK
jgi:curli production assembly/transport component CsgG